MVLGDIAGCQVHGTPRHAQSPQLCSLPPIQFKVILYKPCLIPYILSFMCFWVPRGEPVGAMVRFPS